MNSHKVLHLIDSSGMYGAEKVVVSLLAGLQRSPFPGVLGCISESATKPPRIGAIAEEQGIAVQYFPMKRGLRLSGLKSILEYVRRNKISIVHSHGYKPDILLSLVSKRRFKIVATVHGWSKNASGVKGRIYEFLDALALKRMDQVVAVSGAVREDLASRGIGGGEVSLIYNGISATDARVAEDIASIRARHGLNSDVFVIGSVGRLASVKGHGYLIQAMAEIAGRSKGCQLVIAGHGPLKDEYERLIEERGLSHCVRLSGYIDDISSFMSMIDLFVLPSLSEGLPIALLEAMACARPVIATSVGGIPEVITNDNEGVLVAPSDPCAIASAVLDLMQDRSRLRLLAGNSKSVVEKKFTLSHMATQYSHLYSSLLEA